MHVTIVSADELRAGQGLYLAGIGWNTVLSATVSEAVPDRIAVRTAIGGLAQLLTDEPCLTASLRTCPRCHGDGMGWYQGRGSGDYYRAACDQCGNGKFGFKGTGLIPE